jgi:hypothetical protein
MTSLTERDHAASPIVLNSDNWKINHDDIDRRVFLKCMSSAETGLMWTFAGGLPVSRVFGQRMQGSKQADFQLCSDQRQPHRLQQGRQRW